MSVTPEALERTYADTDDPWNFRTSAYEQAKFVATRKALARRHYSCALELGCGNGALAQHLSGVCDGYVGVDAVKRAIESARRAVPAAQFNQGRLPQDLPSGAYDLIVLSEILYFLDGADIEQLATSLIANWPRAEILCVTWLGDTGHSLQGKEALDIFRDALAANHPLTSVVANPNYRIDRVVPENQP